MKVCSRCKVEKPKNEFYKCSIHIGGLQYRCKICEKDMQLLSRHGISLKTREKMLKAQNYKCAICKTDTPYGNKGVFCVDHCHKTGKIRGLLCDECNIGLGKFRDNIDYLNSAINYLKANT